jgi:hypothetical protein
MRTPSAAPPINVDHRPILPAIQGLKYALQQESLSIHEQIFLPDFFGDSVRGVLPLKMQE